MAGSRIKGITVKIGGDTTKLQTALKGVNSEIKNTQSQLKDVEKFLPASAAVTVLGVAAVKTASDFDSSMSQVAAVSRRSFFIQTCNVSGTTRPTRGFAHTKKSPPAVK